MKRYTVHYSGRVQGVGFRYTASRIAGGYRIAGIVQNLDDGRVRLVAEGDAGDLGRMLAEIDRAMEGHITGKHLEQAEATGEFGPADGLHFAIRRTGA